MSDSGGLPVRIGATVAPPRVSTVAQLAQIPEEEIWLQKQKSERTRRAYRLDVQHFMATLHISTIDELRQADHKAVIAWERYMREIERAAASTIRRRLAALSSLFRHLIDYGGAARNPAREVARPVINRQEGATLAFSKVQARTVPSSRSGCRSGCAVPRSPRSRSATCTRTAGTTRCASCAKAEGATRWRSTRRPRRGYGPIWKLPGMDLTQRGRCFGRSSIMASSRRNVVAWTLTRSIV